LVIFRTLDALATIQLINLGLSLNFSNPSGLSQISMHSMFENGQIVS